MRSLEHKIPPPLVLLIVIVAMGGFFAITTGIHAPPTALYITATATVVLGITLALSGVREFRRFHTTINPRNPEQASSIVDTGVFKFTRNPMYVGMVCVLLGWSLFLATPWALLGPIAFNYAAEDFDR